MIRSSLVAAVCAAAFTGASAAAAAPRLHALFQDNAVVQRDQPLPVYGRAEPGEAVTVTLNGRTATATAGADGRWRATLPALPAGGPYTLTVRGRGGAGQAVHDVLVGDVWLCSGQSNMELPVSRTTNAPGEIGASANDRIRMLTVARRWSATPLETFGDAVSWRAASPATVPDFSASCYYFARELQKTVDVPMGLIHASWGGTAIEPWMSPAALRAVGGYEDRLGILGARARDPEAANARWGAMWERWWRSRSPTSPGAEPWAATPPGVWKPAPRPGFWETLGVPELADFNGMVWMRTTVRLTPAQAAQKAVLSLGVVDDADTTWINGRPIGADAGWDNDRLYPVPAGVLKPGANEVVVNIVDGYGFGGFARPEKLALQLADGSSVPLQTGWRYQIAPASVGSPPRAPWDPIAGITGLYNAMISPIGPAALRGVAWYQGESNTGRPEEYRALLSGLMADWRRDHGANLPFLVVQLANYGAPPTAPADSGWASLREAQRLAVAGDRNAGLAVAIDIGDRYDIHPANKLEVGRRLARAARRVAYGESIPTSGPVPADVTREGAAVVVRFADVDRELVTLNAGQAIGFELCGADQASCRYVAATAAGDRVTVAGDGGPATRVRFCWADSPVCNLYDRSGLPAGPFEAAIR